MTHSSLSLIISVKNVSERTRKRRTSPEPGSPHLSSTRAALHFVHEPWRPFSVLGPMMRKFCLGMSLASSGILLNDIILKYHELGPLGRLAELKERESRSATVSLLFGLVMAFSITGAMMEPLLPLYILEFGTSKLELGFVLSAQSVLGLMALPLGFVFERIGRWNLISFAILAKLGGLAMLSLAPSHLWLYPSVVLISFGGLALFPTANIIASSLSPKNSRGEFMGKFLTAVGFGAVLGPLLPGLLLQFLDMRALFLYSSIPFLAAGLALFYTRSRLVALPKGSVGSGSGSLKETLENLFSIFRSRNLSVIYVMNLMFSFGEASLRTLFPVHAKETLLMAPAAISLLFVAKGFSNLVVRVPAGRLADSFGTKLPLLISVLSLMVSLFLSAGSRETFLLIVVMVMAGGAWGARVVVVQAALGDSVDYRRASLAQGLYITSMEAGRSSGAVFAGASSSYFSIPTAFFLSGLSLTATILLLVTVFREEKKFR